MLHGTQLSFIQLGGGIATGVDTERRKYYKLLEITKLTAIDWSTIAVWTTTEVCSQLPDSDIVFESPVRSGYLALVALTETETG
jgi:hypothetical protein